MHRIYRPKNRKLLNSVIEVPRDVSKDFGVWGKPLRVIRPIVEWLTKPGESLWDGFAGSGSFGCISKELNLRYEGFDIVKSICDEANKRIKNHLPELDNTLFGE